MTETKQSYFEFKWNKSIFKWWW